MRFSYEHHKNEICGGVHVQVIAEFRVLFCMPRWSRIDPLSSALAASKSAAGLGHHDCLRQCINVHVRLVPARLTRRDNGVETPFLLILAKVIGGRCFARVPIPTAHVGCRIMSVISS
jgi:hypothetical protein